MACRGWDDGVKAGVGGPRAKRPTPGCQRHRDDAPTQRRSTKRARKRDDAAGGGRAVGRPAAEKRSPPLRTHEPERDEIGVRAQERERAARGVGGRQCGERAEPLGGPLVARGELAERCGQRALARRRMPVGAEPYRRRRRLRDNGRPRP